MHNVDVISTIDLGGMVRFHREQGALATLAVQEREASRYLLFDADGQLCGRRAGRDSEAEWSRPAIKAQALAFCGVHVISPRLFSVMEEEGVFSIISAYLRLAAKGEKIAAFRADESYWRDLGLPESVMQAARDLSSGIDFGG